jgi:murein DD-endopeptidase MepM/ murein hydrolase activator NlpD
MRARRLVALVSAIVLLSGTFAVSHMAAAAPVFTLPFSNGETWKIIQGYNCGSHRDNEDSLDMIRVGGATRGAPVTAAAPGRVTYTGGSTSIVIIDHGSGYSTMYVHLNSRAVGRGQNVERGQVIGTAGSVGAGASNPHLHFELFVGRNGSDRARNTVPINFAEGYNLPNNGRCNQHGGLLLTKDGTHAEAPAGDAPADAPAEAPGEDRTPPTAPTLLDKGQGLFQVVKWNPSVDEKSGVKGYQLYVGKDPAGTGDWFVVETQAALPALEPGRNYVRIRAIDNVGNTTDWITLLEVDG